MPLRAWVQAEFDKARRAVRVRHTTLPTALSPSRHKALRHYTTQTSVRRE